MRRGVQLALALALVVLLAGCKQPPTGGPSSSSTGPAPPVAVDGQAVYDWVAGVVTKPDGSPHFRVPGTADHEEAALWLAEQMEVPGWTVEWQNFTGSDYMGLQKGGVASYYNDERYCSADERVRLAGLHFSNLVATRQAGSDRGLILGAHWESKREATNDPVAANRTQPVLGANDGASGVGVLLQLLWELKDVDPGFNVQVVLFDGEDGFEDCHPLAGSLWYVHQLSPGPDSLKSPRRMLLLDMVGDPDARFIRESHSVRCDPGLVDLLESKAADHGLADNFPGSGASIQDDHLPFIESTIPAVDLIDFGRGFPPQWHTTQDTMDKLSPTMLGNVASLVLDAVLDPQFSATWPGRC
jgi:Zn-dependent M28 family amino/carboxypeptidase